MRESYRAGARVRTRTLANLSRWPEGKIEALRRVLKGETVVAPPERLAIERSLPHGHVALVLGMAKTRGLDRLVPRRPGRLATLALALVVPASKSLAQVERAFRALKTVELEVRPIHHRLAGRVRAHVFLSTRAYYVQWILSSRLAQVMPDGRAAVPIRGRRARSMTCLSRIDLSPGLGTPMPRAHVGLSLAISKMR